MLLQTAIRSLVTTLVCIGSALLLSVSSANAQAGPSITWDLAELTMDAQFPPQVSGTVGGKGRISLEMVILSDGEEVHRSRGDREHFLNYDWRQRAFEVKAGLVEPVLLDRPVTYRIIATDADGLMTSREATFEFSNPRGVIESIDDGELGVSYPFVFNGTLVLQDIRWRPQIDVTLRHGGWEFHVPARWLEDGTWTTRFDPRKVQGWEWTEEPWTATLDHAQTDSRPYSYTKISFSSEEVAGYCAGYAATVDLAAGQLPTAGFDVILGTEGNDRISSGDGDDVICAGGGVDRIWAGAGNDLVFGGDNRDFIDAGPGNDIVYGGTGPDRIKLGDGDDLGHGEGGPDVIRGGKGDDRLIGGSGANAVLGGVGADFVNSGNQRSSGDGGPGIDLCWRGTLIGCEVERIAAR